MVKANPKASVRGNSFDALTSGNTNLLGLARLDDLKVEYANEVEFNEIAKEIFVEREYLPTCLKPDPRIIDCGAHIGLATLYFKSIYPMARVTCIEPIPDNFSLLRKNIKNNHLSNVTLVNAAVSDTTSGGTIYAEFDQPHPRYCGSSLFQQWANPGSQAKQVKTVVLSSYLDERVDFLKLDVEGMETRVMRQIEGRIHNIAEICVEFHGLGATKTENDLDEIIEILERNNFEVNVTHKIISEIFPKRLLDWADQSELSLALIYAKNRG